MDSLPPDARQELVMSAAALDGQTVTTHRFRSTESADAVAAALRERWRAEGRRFVESRSGDWRVLSVRGEAGLTTVQLRVTASGTEGLSSQWQRASDAADEHALGWPMSPVTAWLPPEARVLRRITHRDPGRDASTVVALVDAAPADAAKRLRAGAARAGFVTDPVLGHPAVRADWYRGGPDRSGEAMAFRREHEEVVATVSAHRAGTAVVMHWSVAR
jgi:hypothetical protein